LGVDVVEVLPQQGGFYPHGGSRSATFMPLPGRA
jgi:hypothetical protein